MNQFNMTRLIPDKQWQIHRDYIAHCLRWNKTVAWLKRQTKRDIVIWDIGCGEGHLLKTMLANRIPNVKKYIGIDVHEKSIQNAVDRYNGITTKIDWDFWTADFTKIDTVVDIVKEEGDQPYLITNYEVLEHLPDRQTADIMLFNMRWALQSNGFLFVSTPTRFDEKDEVTCKNHLFEYTQDEFFDAVDKHFEIICVYGTMMHVRKLIGGMRNGEIGKEMENVIDTLRTYYDSNMVSAFLAPYYPEYSRSQLIVARKRYNDRPEFSL